MGNSTDVIREYYRKPIKPGVAEKYWALLANSIPNSNTKKHEEKPATQKIRAKDKP
jgi:hypothetical protein